MDNVDHPSHYQGCSDLTRDLALTICLERHLDQECIAVIEELNLNFHIGNALKYIWRAGKKGELKGMVIIDIQKAFWYLDRWCDAGGACSPKYFVLRDKTRDFLDHL